MADGTRTYKIIRSKNRKKTMTLQITSEGNVVIRTPLRTPDSETEHFFQSRKIWIAKKIKAREVDREIQDSPRNFTEGEKFYYLGGSYPLEITEPNGVRAPLILTHGKFLLTREKAPHAKELFVKWYRNRAREIIGDRVRFWSTCFDLVPTGITITSAWQRYGSCSAQNSLSFSWRLIMAPYEVIDYIIIHELAHIKEKNHTEQFWRHLESLMPEYKKQRHWLRENSHMFRL